MGYGLNILSPMISSNEVTIQLLTLLCHDLSYNTRKWYRKLDQACQAYYIRAIPFEILRGGGSTGKNCRLPQHILLFILYFIYLFYIYLFMHILYHLLGSQMEWNIPKTFTLFPGTAHILCNPPTRISFFKPPPRMFFLAAPHILIFSQNPLALPPYVYFFQFNSGPLME